MVPAVGGLILSDASVDQTNQGLIVAAPGSPLRMFNLAAFNPNAASTIYLQFFDALTANVTIGTTVPTFVIPLPANGGVHTAPYVPYQFNTGIVFACTATATGSGAPASNGIVSFNYL